MNGADLYSYLQDKQLELNHRAMNILLTLG